MIHLIRERTTVDQVSQMQEALGDYIKLAVDVERELLAGGGAMHADCEAALLDEGSFQENIWGAGWFPDSQQVTFDSLINIRPRQGNRALEVQDPGLRERIEKIVRERFAP
ncbi:DUF5674 family protein [Armatimonas sp.]|uniref:DUF5674 family protein n=1 Tax=Armatimonas sp. TaxID=1872638 RepID=UPI0037525112